ncbi:MULTISPECIES: hypothetical protein [Halorussus]|uniref:hypothetical protein n=1 Tax=Halorussus TaxID=1070314 RepID=UPI0020A1861D|nr:hypothetical protein [Halorussus vallis]USZ75604.1 hypothetical protein NGM07_19520 [Halorussus vallis]
MSLKEAILGIDRAVEQSLGDREDYRSKQEAGRRERYERTIERVNEVAGKEAAEELTAWIETEIREEGRLPDAEAVGAKGAEICRDGGHEVSAESLTPSNS